ncbi:MAG: hypothetical protein H7A32_04735 [Deltaproteobacteria bacterium]|nr:hypothetical protein [Deltaproteobacteria bacterium]
MKQKVSLRLPNEIFENLRQEALELQISVSDVIRQRIIHFENVNGKNSFSNFSEQNSQNAISDADSLNPNYENEFKEIQTIVFEIRLLLREFLFERNAQILRKVDQRLKQENYKTEGGMK